MKIPILFFFFLFLCCLGATAQKPAAPVYAAHERLSLDNGWRFYLGDIPFPVIKGQGMSYPNAKAGKAWGAAAPEFDDTDWRLLNLPHDWAVESPYDSTENATQGYRRRGFGWYRRNFKLDPKDKGKYLELQFDGIATNCTVWVNGTILHRNFCGYTSFYIDITAMAKYGDDLNNIAIRVDAVTQEGWWYEGAGMYRHTWLVKQSPVHIMTNGVFAQPIKSEQGNWNIPVEATIENSGKQAAGISVTSTLLDNTGKVMATGTTSGSVDPLGKTIATLNLPVSNPLLWDLENPALYKVRTIVTAEGKPTDTLFTTCGFRTIKFTSDSGFFLNDKYVKIKGTCNHQDHAGVGVAVPDALWDFRLKKLKEMGVNANRCSHNPPSNEFLDACDRNGIMVMDENRNFNASPEYQRQLEWMVRRDRNHPSIILWSVFNEEPMQGTENGYEMVRRMSAVVKTLDKTRPITAAASGGLFTPINVSHAVDVVGFNYQQNGYERFHKEHPEKAITSSEDVSGLMNRGEYVNDKKNHFLAAYDDNKPGWGNTHRASWKAIAEKPYVAGCFVWTGFDYRGEPQPFEWPSASSSFGCMDVCGFPKTAFYMHQAQWVPATQPILQLVPHWNWPKDSIGKTIRVMAMSNAETIKLLLNGKLIGEQTVDKYEMNTFKVPYQPGKLEAYGYEAGKQVSHFVVETTGEPASIQLIPYATKLVNDGLDALPVTVRVLDAKGRPVETANLPVEFEISGPGRIIGMGNGNNNNHEPEKGNKQSLYNGLAQVILQSNAGSTGQLILTAKSAGIRSASIAITVKDTIQILAVEVSMPVLVLDKWKISPFTATKPDPNQEVASYDMNTWAPIKPGSLQPFDNSFALYRTTFKPFSEQSNKGGKVTLQSVAGKAEIWLDKKLVATKTDAASKDMTIDLPAGQGNRTITVLIEAVAGKKAGLGGVVTVKGM
ncbi:beta-galactosidase GalA [Parasediminibacterium sp. JCM 36343]|uniref:beta-galactosidase GalA n=1 Tax=Parasediminibacterium sp. JCM 36343 TaxID=3374279 RepID=UPI00397A2144